MTVQRRTPGSRPGRVDPPAKADPPARVDPPTRVYQPLSTNTGRDEDPDQVVDEWEEALRGEQASDEPDAAARGVDPPTRRWTSAGQDGAVGRSWREPPPSRSSRATDHFTSLDSSIWEEPEWVTPAGVDDTTFGAFSEESYLPPDPGPGPVREPAPEPEPEPALEHPRPEAATAPEQPGSPEPELFETEPSVPEPSVPEPSVAGSPEPELFESERSVAGSPEPELFESERSVPEPSVLDAGVEPVLEHPDAEPEPEPDPVPDTPEPVPDARHGSTPAAEPTEPAGEEPDRPGAVAEQLFGTYPGVEEHVATQVMPRIVDDGPPPEAAGQADDDTDEQADDWRESTADEDDRPAADILDIDGADDLVHADTDHDTEHDTHHDTDYDTDHDTHYDTHYDTEDAEHANGVHADTVRVDLAGIAAAHAEADHAGHTAVDGAERDLGDTVEWQMDGALDAGGAQDVPATGEARTELIPRVPGQPAAVGAQADQDPDRDAPTRASAGPPRPMVIALALLLVTIVAGAAAYICWAKARDAEAARPTDNIAFVDKAATAEVRDQVSRAVEAIFSYDSTRLDQDEQRALSYITGGYVDEFKQSFAQVRELGPRQKASLVSTVVEAGVERLSDRRATLLLWVNQVGHRADSSAPLKASVRMVVKAERVDGQWKVSQTNQR